MSSISRGLESDLEQMAVMEHEMGLQPLSAELARMGVDDLDEGGGVGGGGHADAPRPRLPTAAASANMTASSWDLESDLEQMAEVEHEFGLEPLSAELAQI